LSAAADHSSAASAVNAHSKFSLTIENGWVVLPSSLKHVDGTPRFHLNFPSYLVTDLGAAHLVSSESAGGYEPPTRDLIERVLRPGDVFMDVGAHWGFFSLQAATHPAGGIDVVSFEPELINATILTENVARNKTANVSVVCAACGHGHGLAPLVVNTTMGHSIRGSDPRLESKRPAKWVPVVTLDGALTNLQWLGDRRVILKIDAEGYEPNIIAGAKALLTSGRVALIVWECGGAFGEAKRHAMMATMVAFLGDCGFRHARPADNGTAGPMVAFDPDAAYSGNVFSFAPQLSEAFQL
jgi:FkbM family methyltransferase